MLVIALLLFGSASAQGTRVLLNDQKVVVTEIEVTPDTPYTLSSGTNGAVWIALDPVTLRDENGRRELKAGNAQFSGPTEQLEFSLGKGVKAGLVVVRLKAMPHQAPTILPFVLASGSDIEDASDRNETLLISLNDCHFRDTRNLGDESQWIPSKPDTVVMRTGSVRWIRPGIHHFHDLDPTPARLVSIEW